MIYSTPLHHLVPHKTRSLQIQSKCRMQPSIIYLPPLGGLGPDKMASLNPDGGLWTIMALVGRGSAALDSPSGRSEKALIFHWQLCFMSHATANSCLLIKTRAQWLSSMWQRVFMCCAAGPFRSSEHHRLLIELGLQHSHRRKKFLEHKLNCWCNIQQNFHILVACFSM